MNILKAEFLKLAYSRRTWFIALASIGISVISSAFTPYALAQLKTQIVMPLTTSAAVDGVYAKSLGGYIFVIVIGVLMMTSEFHNHTAIATFLATPQRAHALYAKLVMAVIAGAIVNFFATIIGMASAAIALTFYPEAAAPSADIFINYPASALLIGAVLAVIGVGVGALIRNQTVAIAVAMLWIFLVDRILGVLFVAVGKYLPTGLITSMMNIQLTVTTTSKVASLNTGDYLDALPAAGLLLLYGMVFAVVAMFTTLRRDID
jgi:ABC-2 type transport system permease protein